MENYQTLQNEIIQLGKRLIEAAENTEPTDNGRVLETLLDKGEREWIKLWEKFVPIDEQRDWTVNDGISFTFGMDFSTGGNQWTSHWL